MAIYDHLKQEELLDLLQAYDRYISEAADANVFRTGWVPVCIEEFYESEYQDVWKAGHPFSEYFYEAVDMAANALSPQALASAIDEFYWVYDTYNYQDNCPDRAEAVAQTEQYIQSGKIDEIKGHLQKEMDERGEANSATLALQILIGQLEQYKKQAEHTTDNLIKGKPFGEVSDKLLKLSQTGLDVWVISSDGAEVQFADTSLRKESYDDFSPQGKWLFDLPVIKVWRTDDEQIGPVILESGLTNDELVFLTDQSPEFLDSDSWIPIMHRGWLAGASFEDRLAYLRERTPFERPFDGMCMDAASTQDRIKLCAALEANAEVYIQKKNPISEHSQATLTAYRVTTGQNNQVEASIICEVCSTEPGKGLCSTMDGKIALAKHEALKGNCSTGRSCTQEHGSQIDK